MESAEEPEEVERAYKALPIYKKGKEISDVVHHIGKLIPEDNEILQDIKGQMMLDARLLTVKIAGAEGAGL